MFSVHCPRHGSLVLLSYLDIEEMRNTTTGIDVTFTCTCGHRGTWQTGGRHRDRLPSTHYEIES